jgi:hypothetical protein
MSSSDVDTLDENEPQTWEDWTEDEDDASDNVKSLFKDVILSSPEAAFEHDLAHYGFDLRAYRKQVGLDC